MTGSGREWDDPERAETRAPNVSLAASCAPRLDRGSHWATARPEPAPGPGLAEVTQRHAWPLELSDRARGG